MSKLLIIAVALIAGYFYFNQSAKPDLSNTQDVSTSVETGSAGSAATETTDASRYRTNHASELAEAQSPRRILFFYASWCPTCIPADKILSSSQSSLPEDVIIYRLNYNDPDTDQVEADLAKKYGVTYQHTFVQIDESGEVVTKWNGGGISELLTNLKP